MFFKGKHEAARMELRFINKTGNRHFDKPSYVYVYVYVYVYIIIEYHSMMFFNIYIYILWFFLNHHHHHPFDSRSHLRRGWLNLPRSLWFTLLVDDRELYYMYIHNNI